MPAKKIGRPTDDPKTIRIDVRIGENDAQILNEYCKRTGKKKPDVVREAIRSLKDK